MKKRLVDCERAIPTHGQAAKVAEPSDGALDDPASLVATQCPAVLGRRLLAVRPMRRDQLDAAPSQSLAQRIAVIGPVPDHPLGLLPRPPGAMRSPDADFR